MPAFHQFVAGFARGDAISNEALVLRGIFRSWGFESDIFCATRRIPPDLRRQVRDIADGMAEARPGDANLLHLSIGSDINDAFAALPGRKAILYHNVTPHEYFTVANARTAFELKRGRQQMSALAGVAEVNMADSRYNASEMEDAGYRDVRVLPLVLDFSRFDAKPDRDTLRKFDDGLRNILFVGRCVPNKRIEDLLLAFSYLQKHVVPDSRLLLVGSDAGAERYQALLRSRVRELGLANVCFAGSLPQDQLNACYRRADLFLSMSEHEGFCIPLVESMAFDVPVMAYDAGAVRETMDGAGVVFREKNYPLVAEMAGRLLTDGAFRGSVVGAQRERIARYRARDLERELRDCLAPILSDSRT